MPQKTVTLEDQVYWELMALAKGRQSAFVNEAVKDAIRACCWDPRAYMKYAQGGLEAARAEIKRADEAAQSEIEFNKALYHKEQTNLSNVEWMEKQKREAEE